MTDAEFAEFKRAFDSQMATLKKIAENGTYVIEERSRQERFFPLYFLAIALALRITKVSGELFKLHKTRQASIAPALSTMVIG